MRRLHTSRHGEPDRASLEGFDSLLLEGDPLLGTADAVSSLRPFGRDLSFPDLGAGSGDPAADSRLETAIGLASQGRELEATQLLRQLVEDRPNDAEARSVLARLLEKAGDLDAALEHLTSALDVAPRAVGLLTRRGALHARMGRAAEAEADLLGAVAADPSYGVAYRYLGITQLRLGRPGEAVGALREARRLAPDDGDVNLALGEALTAAGREDEAMTVLEASAAAAPDDPRVWRAMGRLLDRQDRSEEAMTMYRKARELGESR